MKRTRFVIFFLIALSTSLLFSCLVDQPSYSLKTPEDTIKTFYNAYSTNNFNLIKKTVVDTHENIYKQGFESRSARLLSYKIVSKRIAANEDQWHIKSDADIFVKELWRNNTEKEMSYILRKYNDEWIVINWVAVNEAEEPPDMDELSKQVEEMMKKE